MRDFSYSGDVYKITCNILAALTFFFVIRQCYWSLHCDLFNSYKYFVECDVYFPSLVWRHCSDVSSYVNRCFFSHFCAWGARLQKNETKLTLSLSDLRNTNHTCVFEQPVWTSLLIKVDQRTKKTHHRHHDSGGDAIFVSRLTQQSNVCFFCPFP